MATHAEERAATKARQQSEIEKAMAGALSKAANLLSRQAFGHPPTNDEIHKVLDLIEFVQEARERG